MDHLGCVGSKNDRIEARSPYFRELLFFTRYTLLYGGELLLLEALKRAFQDPAYPLSLGREDELLLVEEVWLAEAQPSQSRLWGTLVPGDVRKGSELRPVLREGAVFGVPMVETLPLAFTVDAKGVRHPESPIPVSFLPLGAAVELPGLEALAWAERVWV